MGAGGQPGSLSHKLIAQLALGPGDLAVPSRPPSALTTVVCGGPSVLGQWGGEREKNNKGDIPRLPREHAVP